MKYRIEYISTFHAGILNVTAFLAEHTRKAAHIFEKIDRILGNLVKMPEMYPVYQDVPAFRFIVIEDYLVFYNVKKQNGIIEIHRLLQGSMDIPTRVGE
jgi:plasmid stabilization system protein ParE